MFKGALIFMCGIAAGVLLFDTALERAAPSPRSLIQQPYAEQVRFTHPVPCDATVDGKCYRRGMK